MIIVTGSAGYIGANFCNRLMSDERRFYINNSRPITQLDWLGSQIRCVDLIPSLSKVKLPSTSPFTIITMVNNYTNVLNDQFFNQHRTDGMREHDIADESIVFHFAASA